MEWGSALEAMQAALELEKTVDFIFFYTVYAFLFLTGKPESARPSQGGPGRQ